MSEIEYVYFDFYFGDGSIISCERFLGYDVFTFSYGWEDCPSGWISRYYWEIKVDENCNVFLIDEYLG